MDYHTLGLGDAASVLTAVAVDPEEHTILISCLYDPQKAQKPYTLCFTQCEHIVWQTFDAVGDLQQLDAELLGLSLGTGGAPHHAVVTTDAFELSFVYGSVALHTPAPASYVPHA